MSRNTVAKFQVFRGIMTSWPALFQQAADFATQLGRERVITISHSEDQQDGVVAVWYWGQPGIDG